MGESCHGFPCRRVPPGEEPHCRRWLALLPAEYWVYSTPTRSTTSPTRTCFNYPLGSAGEERKGERKCRFSHPPTQRPMGISGRGEATPPPDNRKTTSWGIMPLCTAAKNWIFACKIAKNVDFQPPSAARRKFFLVPPPFPPCGKKHSSTWPQAPDVQPHDYKASSQRA